MPNADKNASCREFFVSLKTLTLPSIIILMNCLQVKQNIEEYKSQVYADYSLRKRNQLQGSKKNHESSNRFI